MARFKTVAELFSDPARHCKGNFARTREDFVCIPSSYSAAKWCLSGGVQLVYGDDPYKEAEVLTKIVQRINPMPEPEMFSALTSWNDDPDRTPEEVRLLAEELGI